MFGIGIAVVIMVVSLIALAGAVTSRYKKVGPDEVLVISGRRRRIDTPSGRREVGFRIVRNGGTLVWPVLEKVGHLSLRQMTTEPVTQSAMSKEGVPIEVKAVALFKIASDETGIMNAAERFLGASPKEIEDAVKPVLESHLRSVCGTLTPEDIYRDRVAFQKQIAEHAQTELAQIGINLDILTLHEITDAKGYLDAIGQTRTAEVLRDARRGKAVADQEATVREAEAKQTAETAKAGAEANIAQAMKDRDVKKAQFDASVALERARAEQAGPKAQAESKQAVVGAETVLAEREAERKQKELLSSVIRPAEAKREAMVVEAEGEKAARRLKAEAGQIELEQEGMGEAAKVRNVGQAEGEALKARGEGEAAAIEAKLVAEAEGLRQKAEAMKQFTEATMGLQIATELIHTLPEIIKAAATPMSAIQSVKIVDFGDGASADGSLGPMERVLKIPPRTLAVADETLKATLGKSLTEIIQLVRSGKIDPSTLTGQGDEPQGKGGS